MKKRNRILLASLLLPILCFLTWLVLRPPGPPDPVYQGKRLSVWLESFDLQRLSDGSITTNDFNAASVAVRAMGTNALPFLMQRLRYKDSAFKVKMMRFVRKLPLVRYRFTTDYEINMVAVIAINEMGAEARTILPQLTEMSESKDPIIALNALGAMPNIGPEAVVPLTRALTNADSDVRIAVLSSLSESHALSIPEQRDIIVLAITKTLDDSVQEVRELATNVLLKIDPEAAAKAGVK